MKKIPRARHNEPVCVKAKRREITNYKKYDVVEIIDIEEATNNIITTDWILVEKEKQDGSKTIEARMCLAGQVEELLHKIHRKITTPNNKSLKILLSIALSQGWKKKYR